MKIVLKYNFYFNPKNTFSCFIIPITTTVLGIGLAVSIYIVQKRVEQLPQIN